MAWLSSRFDDWEPERLGDGGNGPHRRAGRIGDRGRVHGWGGFVGGACGIGL